MSSQLFVEKYIEHLIHKWYIFKPSVELEAGNCIDDWEQIISSLNIPSKVTDNTMTDLTRDILVHFRCYDTIDTNFENQVTDADCTEVYQNYKSYKQNESSKREQKMADCCEQHALELQPDVTLHTSDTRYLFSLDDITTNDLVSTFGEPYQTGGPEDKHRYEYKFKFQKHIFSLYDWKNDHDQFYDKPDIYWHVASTARSKKTVDAFKGIIGQCVTNQ
ncbi:MAG: hypothetical protein EBU90_08040 [Proteobacteria bacterium]|nr:hypothetical protein [Pseudomonadota bacterium]NBP15271.1 hypothetical protein [bacterium]